MRRQKIRNIIHIISNWLYVNSIIVSAWFVVSYIEILIKNVRPNPVYFWWNFFILMDKIPL